MEKVIKVEKSSKFVWNSGEKENFTDNIGGNKICNAKFEKLEAIIFDNRLSFNCIYRNCNCSSFLCELWEEQEDFKLTLDF